MVFFVRLYYKFNLITLGTRHVIVEHLNKSIKVHMSIKIFSTITMTL